ncbi:cache domain-containing protein [Agrobacterium sp. O3.4]|uniref:histidine kinase n=2 Tax=Rhizobium/Agrobacterium group TaxID=227290 RepID=A0A546XCJ7_RHIRH|nr:MULTISPECIES: cache domain-containing protein [Rhizobium/Agrobacterium group]MCZ7471017.1 cache domain-containing protein [Rhizobium rhizogenes]MCZ7486230.1 cache domain-containing protein [Rhizobium rhizogenes]TRA98473.1 histidine kinase [Rhizobium rhizogenes]WHO10774.1 cache domain-containing protein [Agrobacterium cucumeris]
MNFRQQIIALSILPLVLAVLAISAFITWQSRTLAESSISTFERNMLKAKESEIVHLTYVAMSAVRGIMAQSGLSDDEKQKRAIELIKSLDYGEDGYFFVYDYAGNSIVHPRQNEFPGRNWLDLIDADGKKVIASLIDTAKAGGGFVQYKWERPATDQVGDKLSYVAKLDDWRWILGTGIYLDEIHVQTKTAQLDFRNTIGWTFKVVALVTVPAVLLVFATGMVLTVSERRLADRKLRQLTQRVIDTQEQERTRLARDLHDGISQSLVGVRYAMNLAERMVKAGDNDVLGAIEGGIKTLNDAIRDVRQLSHALRPPLLDDLGLIAALRALCEGFRVRTGLQATLDASFFADGLKAEASTALYRIAQEALTNVERHAGATTVFIRLRSERGRSRMTIGDNGTGFNSESNTSPGLGLRNMQERVAHFHGILLIKSDDKGTVLTILMPRSAHRVLTESVA